MFSKCLCAYLTATGRGRFAFGANVLVTVAASHEKHAQTARLEN